MAVRKVKFSVGEYYHLYNRGNSKQKIFHDQEDYNRFAALLYACNREENIKADDLGKKEDFFHLDQSDACIVAIGAYCLMPNHFHLLINEIIDNGITRFMRKLCTAYVMYYNKKYKRTGGLFEGKFKSEYLLSDRYLKYIFSYIHLNPVKLIEPKWRDIGVKNIHGVKRYLNSYKYSSYCDYLGENRKHNSILNIDRFPKYFPTKRSFEYEIQNWINFKI